MGVLPLAHLTETMIGWNGNYGNYTRPALVFRFTVNELLKTRVLCLLLRRVHSFVHLFIRYLRAVGRKVLWSSACVCLSVCLSVCVCVCVCVCALFLSARYLKNGFMNHHQIRWVGAGGEPLEEV